MGGPYVTDYAELRDLRAMGIDPPAPEAIERAMRTALSPQEVTDVTLRRIVADNAARDLLHRLHGSPGPVAYLFAFLWRLVAGACMEVFMDGKARGVQKLPRILSLAARRDAMRIADELEGLVP